MQAFWGSCRAARLSLAAVGYHGPGAPAKADVLRDTTVANAACSLICINIVMCTISLPHIRVMVHICQYQSRNSWRDVTGLTPRAFRSRFAQPWGIEISNLKSCRYIIQLPGSKQSLEDPLGLERNLVMPDLTNSLAGASVNTVSGRGAGNLANLTADRTVSKLSLKLRALMNILVQG